MTHQQFQLFRENPFISPRPPPAEADKEGEKDDEHDHSHDHHHKKKKDHKHYQTQGTLAPEFKVQPRGHSGPVLLTKVR